MKTVLRKIEIQTEVRHLNYTLSFMGGPLWVEVFLTHTNICCL